MGPESDCECSRRRALRRVLAAGLPPLFGALPLLGLLALSGALAVVSAAGAPIQEDAHGMRWGSSHRRYLLITWRTASPGSLARSRSVRPGARSVGMAGAGNPSRISRHR